MKLKFRLLSCIVILMQVVVLMAGEPVLTRHEGSIFYTLTQDGKTVHFVGSIHFGLPEFYPLPEAMEKAFATSDTLYVEIDTRAIDQSEGMGALAEMLVLPAGDEVSKHLSKETDEMLRKELGSLLYEQIKMMKAWYSGLVITLMDQQKIGFDLQLGVDKHFIDHAYESGKKVKALESATYQFSLLNSLSPEMQESFVREVIEGRNEIIPKTQKMAEAWKTGNYEGLEAILHEDLNKPEYKALEEILISKRNHEMADKLAAEFTGNGTYFVVIGAAHLIGKEGVASLLCEKLKKASGK